MTDAARPFPAPDDVSQPFWDGIAAGTFRIQRCAGCERFVFYPRPVCPYCMSAQLEWVDATGRGTLHSFTVVHRPPPGFADEEPYVVALVDLEQGPRMITRLVDVDPGDLQIGQALEVAIQGEPLLPYFRPS